MNKIINAIDDLVTSICNVIFPIGIVFFLKKICDLNKADTLILTGLFLVVLIVFKIERLNRKIQEKEIKELEKRVKDFEDRLK